MINRGVLLAYSLLPFIMTNPYYPIFEGKLVTQSVCIAFGLCIYTILHIEYTQLVKNDVYMFIYTFFLQFLIIFPISLLYITLLYALYYSILWISVILI